jgi:hypothetical protein
MGTKRVYDWAKARTLFISSKLTLGQVAKKIGCSLQTIREHAARGEWTMHREQFGRELEKKAAAESLEDHAAELRAWNEFDINLAKAMRSRVARRVNKLGLMDPNCDKTQEELRNLSGIHAETQRTARLALGATTEHSGLTPNPGEDGRPVPRLSDFYQTIVFEGPSQPIEHEQGASLEREQAGDLRALTAPTTA